MSCEQELPFNNWVLSWQSGAIELRQDHIRVLFYEDPDPMPISAVAIASDNLYKAYWEFNNIQGRCATFLACCFLLLGE